LDQLLKNDFFSNRIFLNKVIEKNLVFEIQGGRGSFNKEKFLRYIKEKNIKDYKN